ncbi:MULTISPECIES: LysR substrate-binding domain-containing protein [Altererythrobacter]|uniref:Transcriptional regulator n=1 Tax=Altererythrobacter ishigakiensis TaxID=476157 RepID=A0A562UN04_9SPHN|nr:MULTISPECIES: LysR substrate-binding domain-containing protein [Altererythrobacter]MBO6608690.1 LysR family transcriptional regulator [Altererythrobacter sp.]MBO6642945.1 LysR family transcriptional regulator [Altererythrobacter sp.]MBO6709688.1 LysR family transcriptional regulator [Altererythrobacter sp.]MBO6944004.1 LysR family transcriptional regulator [Altererythrobacter sp.]MDX1703486.1 LysR substrate-binding domain-containing protein [Altererythrobacter ishigakiensis]
MPARRLPPLRALEAFMRTVRLGSARAAAEEIGLSPSALSRRITNLEEFVGKKLFTRARQSMQLTDEGQAFYEAVNPHMEALARAVESQSDNISLLRLRLGVLPLFGSQRLFPHLGELRKRHPLLHIDIDTGPHLEDRVGDTLDAAIILSQGPEQGLHAVRLDHNMVHAICSKEMAGMLGDEVDVDKLAKQTFLIHNELPFSFEAWKRALNLDSLEPAAIDHYDSGQLMLEAAAQGLGIAIMHDDHLRRAADNRLTDLYGVEVESPYSYWFVCKPKALEERPVRLFHDWLVSAGL